MDSVSKCPQRHLNPHNEFRAGDKNNFISHGKSLSLTFIYIVAILHGFFSVRIISKSLHDLLILQRTGN